MVKKLLTLILVLGLVSSASAELVAGYSLDGDLTDSSTGQYGGTGYISYGDPTFSTGVSGQGMKFLPLDGTWATADRVNFDLDALRQCTSQISISLWQFGHINWDPVANWNCIFQAYNDDDDDHSVGVYGLLNSHLPFTGNTCFFASGEAGKGAEQDCGATTFDQTQGRWNHWVFTKDCDEMVGPGVYGRQRFYLNNSLLYEWTDRNAQVFVDAGAYDLGFGAGVGGGGPYVGWIDEFMMYNHILTPGEMTDLYDVPEPATIALLGLGGLALLRRRK